MTSPGVSEVTHLALSPDTSGRYALSALDVRDHQLHRSPVVMLGACRAAALAPAFRGAWSLPIAFLEAGAASVFASPDDLPSAAVGPFFEDVRKGLRQGRSPAQSLRDARLSWMQQTGGAWVRSVVAYER